MNLRLVAYVLSALSLLVAAGCGEKASDSSSATADGAKKPSDGTPYEMLSSNDVIVAVDGKALTKAELERRVDLTLSLAKLSGRFPGNLNVPAIRNRFAKNEAERFVAGAILLNAAQAKQVPSAADARVLAERQIIESYGSADEPYDAFLRRLNPKNREVLGEKVDEAARIYSYILDSAGDAASVSDAEIDDVVAYGNNLKEKSERVLAEQRKKAADIHARLDAGESFELLAADSFTADEDECNGTWGSYTMSALESLYPQVARAVASLPTGEYTAPIELDDGIYIVKLYDREGAGRESAVTLNPEMLTLGRIVVPLPMLYEVGARDAIKFNLLNEKLTRFQTEKLLPELKSKANVDHPNGRIIYTPKKSKGNRQ